MTQSRKTEEALRPLTARSVLASTLLGTDPPELPAAHLVRIAGLFGINENRARVALSRMVASGEATTDGTSRYRLVGHLVDRQRRQAASRAGRTRRWTGAWHLVVVTTAGSQAEIRNRRRRALALARLAELREGTWLRPDNLDLDLPAEVVGHVDLFSVTSLQDGRSLARRLWDLDGWAARASELVALLDRLPPTDWTDLAPGFELSAAVLRQFQADPLLPPDLLPGDWPGDRLRRAYDGWDRRYREVLAAWGRDR